MDFFNLNFDLSRSKQAILNRIEKVLDHQQFIDGPEVEELEKRLSQLVHGRIAITVSSGTDALLLALMSAGVGHEDEVITTPLTWSATVDVIIRLGARPVFVDIDPETLQLDPKNLSKAVSSRTKAIVPVSLYGNIPEMDAIKEVARENELIVIEDGAQSLGSKYKGAPSGALTDIGTTSFFPAKVLGAFGNAGCIFVSDAEHARRIRMLRFHGQSERNHHEVLGLNARMDTIQAAILLERLSYLDDLMRLRSEIAARYNEAFTAAGGRVRVPHIHPHVECNWAHYVVRVQDRGKLENFFSKKSIPFRVHYPTLMCDQPAFRSHCRSIGNLDHARSAVTEIVTLPIYPGMTNDDVATVIETVLSAVK